MTSRRMCTFSWGTGCAKNKGYNHVCILWKEWNEPHHGHCKCDCNATN